MRTKFQKYLTLFAHFLSTQHANLEIANAKVLSSKMDREGSMEADTGELSSCRNYLMEPRSVGKTMQKGEDQMRKSWKLGKVVTIIFMISRKHVVVQKIIDWVQ